MDVKLGSVLYLNLGKDLISCKKILSKIDKNKIKLRIMY